MEIEQEKIKAALKTAKGNIQSTSITDRIKTFEDAHAELRRRAENGDTDAAKLLADYESNAGNITVRETLAHMQLIIIVAALNEGWKPQFVSGEYHWIPAFHLCTPEEMEDISDEFKASCRWVYHSNYPAYTFGGVSYANALYATAKLCTHYSSRLVLKTEELADYAGRQFIDYYCAEMGIELTGNGTEQ